MLFSVFAYAGIQADLDREIIALSSPETALTTQERLFNKRCEMIDKYVEVDKSVMTKAMVHSCKDLAIGVALLAGKDLGKHSPEKVAAHFKKALSKYLMNSEVYIQHDYEHGTSLVFFINGGSYFREYIDPIKALEKIQTLSSEAKLIYFKNKQISADRLGEWVKAAPSASGEK